MPASSYLGPYDSDRVSLAREARVQEIEALERRAGIMSALADDLERYADLEPDEQLEGALRCLALIAEHACACFIREIGQ